MNESNPASLPDGYVFHHIGYATTSLVKEKGVFSFLGYTQEGTDFVDPTQGVAGCFLLGPGPRIELLEDLPGCNKLTPWINAGIKVYHFAYQVNDIYGALTWAGSQGSRVIVEPVPAVAFSGRNISFVAFRNGLIIEFVEKD